MNFGNANFEGILIDQVLVSEKLRNIIFRLKRNTEAK